MNKLGLARHACTAAVMAVAVAAAAPAEAQVKTLKVGIGLTEDHPQGLAVKKFAELVAQKSGGKVTAKLFAGGTLGNDVTMVSALRGGTQEMTVPDSSTLVSLAKDFGVLNLPLTIETEQEADALLDGPFGKKLLDELPEKGLIGLGFWENGFRHVTNSRKPIWPSSARSFNEPTAAMMMGELAKARGRK